MKTFAEFRLTTALLKKIYIGDIVVSSTSHDLTATLKKHPKLVIALNHGPMAGALSGLISITDLFLQSGGATRYPFGITWRTFYKLPVTKQILSYVTQVNKGLGFEDANSLLSDSDFTDCFIMPEGELCSFGNGLDIQPFLSPRFIELAIRNNTPILIAAQQGSEKWAWPINVNKSLKPMLNWLPKNMKEGFKHSGIISIPKPFRRKLSRLYMSFYLYQPKLKLSDLAEDKDKRLKQLTVESDIVRQHMQKMVNQLEQERNEHKYQAQTELDFQR